MRAADERARRLFAEQQVQTLLTRPWAAIGVDEKVMNRASRGRCR